LPGNDHKWVTAAAKLAAAVDQLSPFDAAGANDRSCRNQPLLSH
jgi:hypothetical protein